MTFRKFGTYSAYLAIEGEEACTVPLEVVRRPQMR
jgi:hypothetical protein